MLDWSGVYLVTVRGIDPAQAGFGYAAFAIAMTLGRLTGDRLINAFGSGRIASSGALVASVGLLAATWLDNWVATLACYFLVGIGLANLAPILFSAAGNQKAMPEHLAVAAIATIGYSGILIGPALIGFVADFGGLEMAFFILAASMVSVVFIWLVLPEAE